VRNAQTSVEYLSTYAWAFLALIVTVAALSLFGVFDADTYVPEVCESGSQISCEDSILIIDGMSATMVLQLRNNFPRNINVTKVELTGDTLVGTGIPSYGVVEPGSTIDVPISNGSVSLQEGEKYLVPYTIHFSREGGVTEYSTTGRATMRALPLNTGVNYCGDVVVDASSGEQCDPPSPPGQGMPHPDNLIRYGCTSDCQWRGYCGDGVWQRTGQIFNPGETCRDNNRMCASGFICEHCRCMDGAIPCMIDPSTGLCM
jgi:hypothetical protein